MRHPDFAHRHEWCEEGEGDADGRGESEGSARFFTRETAAAWASAWAGLPVLAQSVHRHADVHVLDDAKQSQYSFKHRVFPHRHPLLRTISSESGVVGGCVGGVGEEGRR